MRGIFVSRKRPIGGVPIVMDKTNMVSDSFPLPRVCGKSNSTLRVDGGKQLFTPRQHLG